MHFQTCSDDVVGKVSPGCRPFVRCKCATCAVFYRDSITCIKVRQIVKLADINILIGVAVAVQLDMVFALFNIYAAQGLGLALIGEKKQGEGKGYKANKGKYHY